MSRGPVRRCASLLRLNNLKSCTRQVRGPSPLRGFPEEAGSTPRGEKTSQLMLVASTRPRFRVGVSALPSERPPRVRKESWLHPSMVASATELLLADSRPAPFRTEHSLSRGFCPRLRRPKAVSSGCRSGVCPLREAGPARRRSAAPLPLDGRRSSGFPAFHGRSPSTSRLCSSRRCCASTWCYPHRERAPLFGFILPWVLSVSP